MENKKCSSQYWNKKSESAYYFDGPRIWQRHCVGVWLRCSIDTENHTLILIFYQTITALILQLVCLLVGILFVILVWWYPINLHCLFVLFFFSGEWSSLAVLAFWSFSLNNYLFCLINILIFYVMMIMEK